MRTIYAESVTEHGKHEKNVILRAQDLSIILAVMI